MNLAKMDKFSLAKFTKPKAKSARKRKFDEDFKREVLVEMGKMARNGMHRK
jgi:hypothetical protein